LSLMSDFAAHRNPLQTRNARGRVREQRGMVACLWRDKV
jgi:hypothetical protein